MKTPRSNKFTIALAAALVMSALVSVTQFASPAEASPPGPNLVPNGSFESDPTADWATSGPATFSWVGSPVRTGAQAVEIVAPIASTNRWLTRSGRVDVTAGEIYRGFVWAQTTDVVGRVEVSYNFYDSSGVRIPSGYSVSPDSLTGTSAGYQRLSVATKAPTGADTLRMELSLIGSGSVVFDDVLIVDSNAAPSEPLPAPTDLGTDITDYLALPGNQVVVVPNGTYSVGDGSESVYSFTAGAHEDVDGEYLGWLVLVAESPHGVVVDMSDTKLQLQTPTSRILFVGFSFVNGTVEFSSMDNIQFWYTNHEYDPCVWVRKYRHALMQLTTVVDPGELDPCGTGGGEYSDDIDDEFKKQAVRDIPGGGLPAPLRDFEAPSGGGAGKIGFYGTDIHNAGDDAWLSFAHDVDIAGMRIWDHAEYQGPRLETIDPQVAPYPTGFTDLIHSDAIEIAFGGSFNWTMTDSWTSRSWYLGGESSGMYFRDLWAGGAPFFQSRFLDRASDMPLPIEALRGFNIGRPTVPASDFQGHIRNLQHIATTGTEMVLQNAECGIRSWPAAACVSAFAPTFTFQNITQGLPSGVTDPTDWFDPEQVAAHLEAIKVHPDNPANIWRCDFPYDAWANFSAFNFVPSYLDVPDTPGCGIPDPPAQLPSFDYSANDAERSVGETATFAVIVNGSPAPALQWRRDGQPIVGATGSEYRIESVVAGDDGAIIDVVATNSSGSATSAPALLTILETPAAPTIEQQPSDLTVTEGESGSLSVGVAGFPAPTLQWRRDGAPIAGATSAVLAIGPVALADDGATYDVVATNNQGSITSSAATLDVDALPTPPVITSQPAPTNLTLNVNGTASLSVVATADPSPTLQWRRNGIDIPGATGGTLSIGPVDETDDGAVFDVVATNSEGAVISDAVTLTVSSVPRVLFVAGASPAPSAERPLVAHIVDQGYLVTVVDDDVVQASDADDAELVIIASSVTPTTVGATFAASTTPVLTWEAYLYDDFGFVSAGSQQGESSAATKIDIVDAGHPIAAGLTGSPTVLTSATPMSRAQPGGDVSIVADLAGPSTQATVFAYDEGASMAVGVAPARRVGFLANYLGAGRLNTNGYALLDAAIEWALESPEPVTPQAPAFAQQPTPTALVLEVGEVGSLTTAVTGTPTPDLQWRRDGVDIVGAEGTTLNVGPVSIADDGVVFDLVATNASGSVVSTPAGLTVTEPPPQPPAFASQPSPSSLLLVVGGSSQLSVAVSGTPTPTIQWRRDGVAVSGATGSTLPVGPVSEADDGAVFDAVATNSQGSVTSNSVGLTVTAGTQTVVFVAGTSGPPSRERALVNRLLAQGFAVSVVDDDVVTAADADGADLVIIASSVVPTKVDDLFTTTPVPIVTWETYLYDELGFVTASGQSGESAPSRQVDIVDPQHPIAAGLSGSPTVLTTAQSMSFAMSPGGDVSVIAELSDGSSRATVFAYESGAPMAVGQAPARRVGLMPNYFGAGDLNGNGSSMFDAAVTWAMSSSIPPTPSAPTITVQPTPASSLIVGDSLEISVVVSGSPTPSLQWRRNNVAIAGATSALLQYGPVVLADDGAVFDVVATNSAGSVISNAATISVDEPPPGITVEGQPTVTVSPGIGTLDVSWTALAGITTYQLRYRPDGGQRVWDAPTTATSRLITGLTSGLSHAVEVRALDGSWGPWTTVNVVVG